MPKLLQGSSLVAQPDKLKESKPRASKTERRVVGPATATVGGVTGTAGSVFNLFNRLLPSYQGSPAGAQVNPAIAPVDIGTQRLRREYAGQRGITPESLNPVGLGEQAVDFAAGESIPFALSGGLSGGVKGAARAGATILGAHAGGRVGQAVGQGLGLGETAQGLLGLGGSIAGAGLAHQGTKGYLSTELQNKVDIKNAKKFNESKAQRAQELKQNYTSNKNTLKQQRSSTLNELHNELSTGLKNTKQSGQNRLAELENQHKANLQQLDAKKFAYEQKIVNLIEEQNKLYGQAEQARPSISGSPKKLDAKLNDIYSKAQKGIPASDKAMIQEILGQFEGHYSQGNLSLADAVDFQKNLNLMIYDQKLSPATKKYITETRNAINEFIKEAGEAHPEHGQPFSQAEKITQEKHDLLDASKEFAQEQKVQQRALDSEYKAERRALEKEIASENKKVLDDYKLKRKNLESEFNKSESQSAKQYEAEQKALHKETYSDFAQKESKARQSEIDALTDQIKQERSESKFKDKIGMLENAISGVAYYLGGWKSAAFTKILGKMGIKATKALFDEAKRIHKLVQENPELLQELKEVAQIGLQKNTPVLLSAIGKLNKSIKQVEQSKDKKAPGRLY